MTVPPATGRDGTPTGPAGQALLAAYERWKKSSADTEALRSVRQSLDELSLRMEADRQRGQDAASRHQATRAAKALRKARAEAALAGPALEARALRKGSTRIRKALAAGKTASLALDEGFLRYRDCGGKLTRLRWDRALRSK